LRSGNRPGGARDILGVAERVEMTIPGKATIAAVKSGLKTKPWREDVGLMAFLKLL
jgi:hypothetical protein